MATQKNYKTLQANLDAVLEKLQSDELDIDEALKLYKQGQVITGELEAYLKNSQNEIKKISK